MDKATLHQRLQAGEVLLQRMEDNIAFQRQTIATLDGGGHGVDRADWETIARAILEYTATREGERRP